MNDHRRRQTPTRYATRSIGVMVIVVLISPAPFISAAEKTTARRAATVVDLAGKRHSGRLQKLSSQSVSLVKAGVTSRFEMTKLLRLDTGNRTSPPSPGTQLVVFANGDLLVCNVIGMADDNLTVQRADVKTLIPLETVRGLLMRIPDSPPARDALILAVGAMRAKSDLLIFRNGDRVAGSVKTFDEKSVSLRNSTTSSPRSRIAAIAFDPRYIVFPKSTGQRILVRLTDGSRLMASKLTQKGNARVEIGAVFGKRMDVALDSVASLRVMGDKTISLSDLKPVEYRYTPFFNGRRKWQPDRNANKGRLMLRGREYAKGVGLHSQCRLTFAIPAKCRHFLATVGIDDSTRGKGSARVAVELDGKRVFRSPEVTGKSQPISIGPIPVAGKSRITLIVEFGQFGDILDRVNWCDAVLVK